MIDYARAVIDEMIWDDLIPFFAEIVSLAGGFVACSTSATSLAPLNTPNQKRVVFNLDTGIIVPLYFIAGKCRDSRIRRKAIELLRASEKHEGVSNTLMTAKVAERLVDIEEKGMLDRGGEGRAPQFVGMERGVSGVEIRFEGEGKRAWLRYSKPGVG